MPFGRSFVIEATRAGIPFGAILLACRNWGLPPMICVDLAEEATQEAHLRGLDVSFPVAGDYYRWVTVIGRRFAIDVLRRKQRAINLGDGADALTARVGKADDQDGLAGHLEGLPEEDQCILRMTFVDGMTLDEIVAVVFANEDASPNALRLRVKRRRDLALGRLRREIK